MGLVLANGAILFVLSVPRSSYFATIIRVILLQVGLCMFHLRRFYGGFASGGTQGVSPGAPHPQFGN